MTPETARELWVRFLGGEDLSPEEERDLIQALENDPALRESFVQDVQFDGELRARGASRGRADQMERTLADCLQREGDATNFIQKIEQQLGDAPPSVPRKRLTGFWRRHARTAASSRGWAPALAAAGLFVGVLGLFVTLSSTGTPRHPAPRIVKEQPPAPMAEVVKPLPPSPAPDPRPRIEEERRLQEHVAQIQKDLEQLVKEPAPQVSEQERKAKIQALEEEMKQAIAALRARPVDPVSPSTTPGPAPKTLAGEPLVVVFERVEGSVFIPGGPLGRKSAQAGDRLLPGQKLDALSLSASATLVFKDGTRVEVGPQTIVTDVREGQGAGKGKRVFIERGTVQSVIARQPFDQPMIFLTQHAESTVLGTTIRLVVTPDAKAATTLEVKEGKVRFSPLGGSKTVVVEAGQFAIAAAGVELVARPIPPSVITVNFGPVNAIALPTGVVNDAGEEFDSKRGYGWKGPITANVPWTNPVTGARETKKHPRGGALRGNPAIYGPLKVTHLGAGWADQYEMWTMTVPNGRYDVTVSVGDPDWEQGPHHVWLEGRHVIDATKGPNITRPGVNPFIELKTPVEVKDGELTMIVGGYFGSRVSSDGSTDTILNFIKIEKVADKKK